MILHVVVDGADLLFVLNLQVQRFEFILTGFHQLADLYRVHLQVIVPLDHHNAQI